VKEHLLKISMQIRKDKCALLTLVYPSTRRSNLSYASTASSRPTSCETTNDGFATPEMIRSRRYLLYALTLHCLSAVGVWVSECLSGTRQCGCCVPCTKGEALLKKLAERNEDLSFPGLLVRCTGIGGHVS